jgi:hypothetical protein
MTNIAASNGSKMDVGTTPRMSPPINVPIIDPTAITSRKLQFLRSTPKL